VVSVAASAAPFSNNDKQQQKQQHQRHQKHQQQQRTCRRELSEPDDEAEIANPHIKLPIASRKFRFAEGHQATRSASQASAGPAN